MRSERLIKRTASELGARVMTTNDEEREEEAKARARRSARWSFSLFLVNRKLFDCSLSLSLSLSSPARPLASSYLFSTSNSPAQLTWRTSPCRRRRQRHPVLAVELIVKRRKGKKVRCSSFSLAPASSARGLLEKVRLKRIAPPGTAKFRTLLLPACARWSAGVISRSRSTGGTQESTAKHLETAPSLASFCSLSMLKRWCAEALPSIARRLLAPSLSFSRAATSRFPRCLMPPTRPGRRRQKPISFRHEN